MSTTTETERESPLHPGVKLERRLPVFYASFFYAFPAAVAWIWLEAAKPGRTRALWATLDWPVDLAIGVAAGLAGGLLSVVLVKAFGWARKLESEFGWILGGQRVWEIAWIALLSGCAEEFLFRGALQEKFGIWVATAVFAVIHWPVNPNFRAWPFLAAAAGLGFGGLQIWTDSLVAPAAAHVVLNFVNLLRITKRYRAWDEERVGRWLETGT
ncbi:MAG TPA: type II CAAX endopeptidase family protein [Planctomycetota bacterium]